MSISAIYFDGKRARSIAVSLSVLGKELLMRGEGIERNEPLTSLKILPPLAGTPRIILLVDGGRCEVGDHQALADLLPQLAQSPVHGMEASWQYALIALIFTLATLVAVYFIGLPLLAEQVAKLLPAELALTIDQRFLADADRALLEPSKLDSARRQAIETKLRNLTMPEDLPKPTSIEFRSSPHMGANAFALPGGTILVFDQLVTLADHDEEIIAVLAHEMGHVAKRHALRQILQASVVGLAVAWYLGDVSSLLATAPTVILESRYSRDFERTADSFAIELLQRNAIAPSYLADMLEKLEAAHADKTLAAVNQAMKSLDYLSTHPNSEERIRRIREIR